MFYIYTGFQSKTAKKGKLSYSLRRTTHAVLLKNRGTLKEQDTKDSSGITVIF